jgi:hypothetical protein
MVSIDFHSKKTAGPKDSNEPRLVGQIWSERLATGNDDFIVAYRQHLNNSRREVAAL